MEFVNLSEVCDKTTINNQYIVLTSSQNGLIDQNLYFNKQIASKDNVGYKIIKKGQYTYRSMSDTGLFFINRLKHLDYGIVSPAYPVFELKSDKVLPEYLDLYFKSNLFQYQINNFSRGTTRLALKYNKLITLIIAVPSLEKQMKIIEEINKIEDIKKLYNQNLLNLDNIVKSQFIEMFDACNEYTNITNCVDIMDHLRKPINSEERMKMQEGILYPYYGATGQVGYINDYLSDFEGLCIAEDCGNYKAGEESAYIVKGKIWVNNHAHLLKCKENYNLYFLKEFLFQADLSEYVNGATRQKLTQSKLREIKVLNPSLELQNKFADFVQQIDKSKYFGGVCYGIC